MAFFLDNIVWFLAIPIFLGAVVLIKKYWPGYKDDNKVENFVEDVIESKTGLKIDLTPESKEADDRWKKEQGDGETKSN